MDSRRNASLDPARCDSRSRPRPAVLQRGQRGCDAPVQVNKSSVDQAERTDSYRNPQRASRGLLKADAQPLAAACSSSTLNAAATQLVGLLPNRRLGNATRIVHFDLAQRRSCSRSRRPAAPARSTRLRRNLLAGAASRSSIGQRSSHHAPRSGEQSAACSSSTPSAAVTHYLSLLAESAPIRLNADRAQRTRLLQYAQSHCDATFAMARPPFSLVGASIRPAAFVDLSALIATHVLPAVPSIEPAAHSGHAQRGHTAFQSALSVPELQAAVSGSTVCVKPD